MKHFTINELCASRTAAERGIDNSPDAASARRLTLLVDCVLDPLREAWGRPIAVSSGYRCPALNRAVGGAARSQHLTGQAADITAGSSELNRQLFELAQRLRLPFDQLIDERHYAWLHISHADAPRRQILHL